MSRYWKCTMTNDEDSFRVGDIYETDDEKRNFVDGTYFYFVEQCIDELSVASFEEIIEETKEELKMQKYGDKYWKCTYSEGDWFKEGKIYITDVNGRNATNEFGMKLEASIPNEFIPNCTFKEVSHDDWMEQEYKAYYKEEEKMKNKRYWKCIESNNDNDFTVGRVYVSDENKQNTLDNEDWLWEDCEIDGSHSFKFVEVDKDGNELCPNQEVNKSEESNYEMVNHPSHYNSNSKGIEVIDVMDAFTEGLEGIDAIDIGTAIKYIGRLGKKDNLVQEVKKAIWYLQHYVDRKEEENDND